MIYCIPLDEATEEFYASVARAAGLPIEQVLRCLLYTSDAADEEVQARGRAGAGGAGPAELKFQVKEINRVVFSGSLCYHAGTSLTIPEELCHEIHS